MIKQPVLRSAVEEIQRGVYHPSIISIQSIVCQHDTTISDDSVFPLDQRALSITDDYYASYTVTMVDVRSCTRPPRSHDQQRISEHPHTSIPPRSPDQTRISECTGISRLPRSFHSQSSTNIGFQILQSHYSVLVWSMPVDYRNTVSQLERHLTGDDIGSILECKDVFTANQRILSCLIEQINTKEGLLDFCERLNSITNTPALTAVIESVKKECMKLITDNCEIQYTTNVVTTITNAITHTTTNTTVTTASAVTSSSVSVASPTTVQITSSKSNTAVGSITEVPKILHTSEDFSKLKVHYHTILQLMPDNYELTVEKLMNHIKDDQICEILNSSNSTIANKRILDCLIEKMSCIEELLDLCDQLENISSSHDLKTVINEIRLGVQQSIQFPINTKVTTNTQSLLPTDQHKSTSPSINSPFYQMMLLHISLDPDSKVLTVLKKNYTRLCQSLPKDHMKTINEMKRLLRFPDNMLNNLTFVPSVDLINENIIVLLITMIVKSDIDGLKLCDVMENLVDSKSSADIETLRNEILETLSSLQVPVVTKTFTTTTNTDSSTVSQQFTTHPTLSASSVIPPSTSVNSISQLPQPKQVFSKLKLQKDLRYKDDHLQKGFKYLRPPPIPSIHVKRQILLDEIATKLVQATNDPDVYETTLTITGAGGFGKTTTVKSLCYNPIVKEQFPDGFVFIELGPQATDPSIKLSQLYHLLTGENLKQCDINHVEQEISQLTSNYYRNLLVIIDDVWHVEDAMPLVKAFSNCKTILTTRMNDIEQYIPSKESISIGPMTINEAISLLTCGIIESSQLLEKDGNLLRELAQDVHLWPLLLSLIRGQLSHNLKKYHFSYQEAIENVQAKLHHKGLKAFDKNNINTVNKPRNLAVKACIETTLELLTESLSDKIKTLILWTGIGTSLQTAVLNYLWNISEQEAEDAVDVLWAYGLVQFTDTTIPPNNITQHCVEVHTVISQYITECMDYNEVFTLSPHYGKLNTASSVIVGLSLAFQQSHGIFDKSSLTTVLKYQLNEIENVSLPYYIKAINMQTVIDPHEVLLRLQQVEKGLVTLPYYFLMLVEEINSLTTDCKQILNDAHKMCRKFNQNIQRNLYDKNYDKLIETVKEFITNYSLCNVAQKAIAMVNKIKPYCDDNLLHYMMVLRERFQLMTTDYHEITMIIIPYIELNIKLHKQITSSLLNGSPDIKLTYDYIVSGDYNKEIHLVRDNRFIKLRKIAPNYVHEQSNINIT